MDKTDPARTISYKFKFDKGNEKTFVIKMDRKTLDLIDDPKDSYPEWANLEYQQCSNCPLDPKDHPHCPIAMKMTEIVDFFCKPIDCEAVDLSVQTPERTYKKRVGLRSSVVSLIGIYMATSGCPIMDKLRPMARHHLPLATTPETTYRSLANYLIAQYLLAHQGKEPDWELNNLGPIYDAIKTVNMHFRKRLLKVSREDYALNAILTLDAHAYYINLSLIGDTFYTIENLFDESVRTKSISYDSSQKAENGSGDIRSYQYQFIFNNNYVTEFNFDIDAETLYLLNTQEPPLPSWTKLDCQKCPNCPLDQTLCPHCPAAAGIANVMESLSETLAIPEADILVKTVERDFFKHTSVAEGLSSMMSLLMISSGCPVLSRLKPLANHHLPFESTEERIYRTLGMYLLHQKFSPKSKGHPDWTLNNWPKFFEEINMVRRSFCSRFREIPIEGDILNILINLDCFIGYRDFRISEDHNRDLQKLFERSYS
ncbi:MAG: hypothetical protein JW847_03095 [Candidatus Omnitrophica bacterium]|nr:hypothetical protein [Candidatus Omnitrophota bacterium]